MHFSFFFLQVVNYDANAHDFFKTQLKKKGENCHLFYLGGEKLYVSIVSKEAKILFGSWRVIHFSGVGEKKVEAPLIL